MHPVVELIQRRVRGLPADGKLALVVGGGAMRGVVSLGMLMGLDAMGGTQVFDAAYGSSAGAANLASWLARTTDKSLSLYTKEMASRRFFRMRSHGPYVDIHYLVRRAHELNILDQRALFKHKTNLSIAATDIATGEAMWFLSDGTVDVFKALEASCALPAFFNKPVEIAGRRYLDGSVVEPLPVARAIADGATHILVLSTLPRSFRYVVRHPLVERWARRKVRRIGHVFFTAYARRVQVYNEQLDLAFGRRPHPPGVWVLTISPESAVRWIERSQRRLLEAAWHGFHRLVAAFQG